MKKLRIALVIPGVSLSSTGPSVSVKELAYQLCGLGHEVTLVASNLSTGGGPPGEMIAVGSSVEFKFFPTISPLERRLYRSWAMRRWFDERVGTYDVVDIQGIWSFVAVDAAFACARAHVPYVITPRGQMSRWDWRKSYARKLLFFSLYLHRVWGGAAAIRFLSEQEVGSSAVKPLSRSAVIPNWVKSTVPVSRRQAWELRRELNIPQDASVILFLGRMTEQKGVAEIVAAFDRLARSQHDSVLVLVGPRDEPYGTMLDQTIASLTCCERIRLLGPIYDDRRLGLLSIASTFITLSKNEGLPVAVLEALASGLPAVVTEATNLPEIAQYGAGVIVGQDPAQVAGALLAIIEDQDRRRAMSEQARKLAAERFSPEAVVPRLLALYRTLASDNIRGDLI